VVNKIVSNVRKCSPSAQAQVEHALPLAGDGKRLSREHRGLIGERKLESRSVIEARCHLA